MLKQLNVGDGLTKEQQEELENIANGEVAIQAKRGKKLFRDNMAENSDEFKQLGTLHRDGRVINYYPQDAKANFSSKPQNVRTEDFVPEYHPDFGYFSQSRVPQNLVGDTFKQVRLNTDQFNKTMMAEQRSIQNTSFSSGFPLTTNQDYHNEEVFDKARGI